MQHLIKVYQKQETVARKEFLSTLKSDYTDIVGLVSNWHMKNLLPKDKQKTAAWSDIKSLKAYVIKRYDKRAEKREQEFMFKVLGDIVKGGLGKIEKMSITVTWSKSRTWGSNPTAEISFSYRDNNGILQVSRVNSRSISGCGFDKESTAVAEALNQITPLMQMLYKVKNTRSNASKKNGEVFGYGSGYGLLPTFEGGVGVNCFPAIFESIGLTWSYVAQGKTFNVYSIKAK